MYVQSNKRLICSLQSYTRDTKSSSFSDRQVSRLAPATWLATSKQASKCLQSRQARRLLYQSRTIGRAVCLQSDPSIESVCQQDTLVLVFGRQQMQHQRRQVMAEEPFFLPGGVENSTGKELCVRCLQTCLFHTHPLPWPPHTTSQPAL